MLRGKKVELLPLEKVHLERSRRWVNDAFIRSRVLRVLPVTNLEQEAWYQDIVHNPTKMVFAIKTVEGNRHIGNTGFYHIDWIHRRAEFWILIGEKDYRGKEIGKEVVSLMKQYAFYHLNLRKVYLHVGSDNKEAAKLYSNEGFYQEGILKEHYFIDGKYQDVIIMAVIKDEE